MTATPSCTQVETCLLVLVPSKGLGSHCLMIRFPNEWNVEKSETEFVFVKFHVSLPAYY